MRYEKNIVNTQVTCPECHTIGIFHAKQLIDTMKDPNALEKVLSAEWFTYTCPACGERQIMLFSCLFHDAQNRLLYAYADTEEDYAELSRYLRKEADEDGLGEVLNGWIDTCTCRITNNFSTFQEKLLLAYLGLDDRAIEICKYMTEMIVTTSNLVDHVENMYFNTDGDDWVILIDTGEEEMSSTRFPKEMYQEVLDKLVNRMSDEENEIVYDLDWARRNFARFS